MGLLFDRHAGEEIEVEPLGESQRGGADAREIDLRRLEPAVGVCAHIPVQTGAIHVCPAVSRGRANRGRAAFPAVLVARMSPTRHSLLEVVEEERRRRQGDGPEKAGWGGSDGDRGGEEPLAEIDECEVRHDEPGGIGQGGFGLDLYGAIVEGRVELEGDGLSRRFDRRDGQRSELLIERLALLAVDIDAENVAGAQGALPDPQVIDAADVGTIDGQTGGVVADDQGVGGEFAKAPGKERAERLAIPIPLNGPPRYT